MQTICVMNPNLQTSPLLSLQFDDCLHRSGLRTTRTRRQIFLVLLSANKPLTIRQLVAVISDSHFVSIYRSVHLLTRAGCLKQVPVGLSSAFELSDIFKPHHHHATCEECGTTVEIHDAQIESVMKHIAHSVGFTVRTHHFELYGLCASCRSNRT